MQNKRYKSQVRLGDRDLLTRAELAERLQVSYTTICMWTKQGKIPAVHHPLGPGHGRFVLYSWAEVEAHLENVRRPADRRCLK